jgi:ribonuclease HII
LLDLLAQELRRSSVIDLQTPCLMRCGLRYERAIRKTGINLIAGVDEAGRGPLAGPVVAAAVILPERFRHRFLRDSKQLTAKQREDIYSELTRREDVSWAVAVVEHDDIDQMNILRATYRAMCGAVESLASAPEHVLIDGRPVHPFPFPQTAIIDGDALSLTIAAASVVAKVTRDHIMIRMEALYPGYGFAQHKGYATALHLERLDANGPCPIHRRSFLPVAQLLSVLG